MTGDKVTKWIVSPTGPGFGGVCEHDVVGTVASTLIPANATRREIVFNMGVWNKNA